MLKDSVSAQIHSGQIHSAQIHSAQIPCIPHTFVSALGVHTILVNIGRSDRPTEASNFQSSISAFSPGVDTNMIATIPYTKSRN